MIKYTIKNCPCYDHDYEECLNTFRDEYKKCYDCTDCVMKQIVELCKRTCRTGCTNNCLGKKKYYEYGQILKLLDIQEISK